MLIKKNIICWKYIFRRDTVNKQRGFWIALILIFILSFSYFLYQRYVPEKTNITDEQTEEAMKKLEEQYNTKELIIVFKQGVSEGKVKEIISEFDGEIVDHLPEIQNYRLKIGKKLTTEEVLYLIEDLNNKEEISLAVLNDKAEVNEDETFFNDNDIENNKVFDEALSIYNKPANVFYSKNGTHTFLYPSTWDVSEEGKLISKTENKELTYILKKSEVDLYEDVIQNYIAEEEKQGLLLDSEMDVYEENGLIVTKWIVKSGDVLIPRALIQSEEFYYYFKTNDKVSLDEFSLIVDSFIINKDPLKNS